MAFRWVLIPGLIPKYLLTRRTKPFMLHQEAAGLLAAMNSAGVAADDRCYASLITAFAEAEDLAGAMGVLASMPLAPTGHVYRALTYACARAGAWEQSLDHLRDMRHAGLTPDAATFTNAICACGKAGRADEAAGLLASMRSQGLQPVYDSYKGAAIAYAKAGRWREASQLLAEMRRQGLPPDPALELCVRRARSTAVEHEQGGHWDTTGSMEETR
jgi:pentatricopeptide repeat protein